MMDVCSEAIITDYTNLTLIDANKFMILLFVLT